MGSTPSFTARIEGGPEDDGALVVQDPPRNRLTEFIDATVDSLYHEGVEGWEELRAAREFRGRLEGFELTFGDHSQGLLEEAASSDPARDYGSPHRSSSVADAGAPALPTSRSARGARGRGWR